MRSIQRITLSNTLASQQHVLRVLYPPGNDTVLDVTVTAAAGSEASLLHPLLGVNLTVNGVAIPRLIAVSQGQAAAEMLASLLQEALKVPATDVGVELLPTQGSGGFVGFRVAVSQAQVATLSVTAKLAVITPDPIAPPVCPNSTCFYATPVWVPDNSTTDATQYVQGTPGICSSVPTLHAQMQATALFWRQKAP